MFYSLMAQLVVVITTDKLVGLIHPSLCSSTPLFVAIMQHLLMATSRGSDPRVIAGRASAKHQRGFALGDSAGWEIYPGLIETCERLPTDL